MRYYFQEVVCFLRLAVVFACVSTAMAQYPAGLSSTGPASAFRDKQEQEQKAAPGSYNLKLGQVKFSIGLGIRQEYNDNVTLARGAERDADFITTPNVSLNAFWPFSKLNTLDFTIGMGYSKYWKNPELDSQSILISPDSMLDFNVYVGDIRFNIYDELSIQEDPSSNPQLSGTAKFRRLENAIGVKADLDLNKIVLGGGFEHQTFKALNNGSVTANDQTNGTSGRTFSGLDHEVDALFGQVGYKVNPKMLSGIRANYSQTKYTGDQQNNSTSTALGAFLDGQPTRHISAAISIGYQMQEFKTGGLINDSSNFNSYIFEMSVRHELNRFYSHNVSFNRYAMGGIGSNFTEIQGIDYGFTWVLIKDTTLNGNAYFQTVKNSGSGPDAESADRYGFSVKAVYELFRSWDLGAGYDFLLKDSSIPVNDYLQNRVYFDLTYNF